MRRCAFAGDHTDQSNWTVRRKAKHGAEKQDPDLERRIFTVYRRFSKVKPSDFLDFTSFSDTPMRTEKGWMSWTQRGLS